MIVAVAKPPVSRQLVGLTSPIRARWLAPPGYRGSQCRPAPSARSPSCRGSPNACCPLHQLAYNLWWCWHADAVALFRRIDPDRFEQLDHSPIRLLTSTTQKRFEELATDDGLPRPSRPRLGRVPDLPVGTRPGSRNTHPDEPTCGSPTSRPSSASTNRCRFTPAASACWPATT